MRLRHRGELRQDQQVPGMRTLRVLRPVDEIEYRNGPTPVLSPSPRRHRFSRSGPKLIDRR